MNSQGCVLNRSLMSWAVFFFAAFPFAAQAEFKTTVVDGRYDEWDLSRDRFPPTHGAKESNDGLSNIYLRYNSETNTVFILVLRADSAHRPQVSQNELTGDDHPLELNSLVDGGTGNHEITPRFFWVMDGDTRIGWEGAFQLDLNSYGCAAEFLLNHNDGMPSRGTMKKASEVKVIDMENFFSKCK